MATQSGELVRGEYQVLPIQKVVFGPGSVATLAAEVERLGIRRALIVTSNTLATKTDLVKRVRGLLGERCAGVFHKTVQHVPRSIVFAAAEMARQVGADGLVSFGGSTCAVTCRAVALCVAEGVTTGEGLDRYKIQVVNGRPVHVPEVRNAPMPILCVPTTLSAGEYTNGGGVTNEATGQKEHYRSDRLTPRTVILDPELTLATPDWLWFSTGVKALDHCVEGLYSPRRQPMTDALYEAAAARLFQYLPRSRRDPRDMGARNQCLIASWMAGVNIPNTGMALSHSIGHQLGGRFGVPHGYTSCVTLPGVMEFNREAVADRLAVVARAAGVATARMQQDRAARAAVRAMRGLVAGMGLPGRIRDVGVAEADLPALAAGVMLDYQAGNNPRPVDKQSVLDLLRAMY